MANTDKPGIDDKTSPFKSPREKEDFVRNVGKLITELGGRKWKLIAKELVKLGYPERDSNTIRNNYDRYTAAALYVPSLKELNETIYKLENRLEHLEARKKGNTISDGALTKQDIVKVLSQLVQHRSDQSPSTTAQTSNTGPTVSVEEMTKAVQDAIKPFIEASVTSSVASAVEQLLDTDTARMLVGEIIDQRLSGYLRGIEMKESHSGPGRGKSGKTHSKFSASLPTDLYEQAKNLRGQFSSHLAAALQLYLRAREQGE